MKANKLKPLKEAHVPNKSFGTGDFYGTGIRAKYGKMRSGMGIQEITPAKIKKPPKTLA